MISKFADMFAKISVCCKPTNETWNESEEDNTKRTKKPHLRLTSHVNENCNPFHPKVENS